MPGRSPFSLWFLQKLHQFIHFRYSWLQALRLFLLAAWGWLENFVDGSGQGAGESADSHTILWRQTWHQAFGGKGGVGGGRTVGRTQNGGILGVRPKVLVFPFSTFLSLVSGLGLGLWWGRSWGRSQSYAAVLPVGTILRHNRNTQVQNSKYWRGYPFPAALARFSASRWNCLLASNRGPIETSQVLRYCSATFGRSFVIRKEYWSMVSGVCVITCLLLRARGVSFCP